MDLMALFGKGFLIGLGIYVLWGILSLIMKYQKK